MHLRFIVQPMLAATLLAGCASSAPVIVAKPVPGPPVSVSIVRPNVTGNWLAAVPANDGTFRRSYFNLVQQGDRITGTVRTTQFFFQIAESAWDTAGFVITGVMRDGGSERRVTYEGRLVGNELRIAQRRRPPAGAVAPPGANRPPQELVAHRVAAGEGAMPARIALPARHVVKDNGIARTPAMGWNSWNKFAGRVDDAGVRAMADAMASNGMREAGYVYVNIDDTWEGDARDAQGNITTNSKFPDMKALADYVHAKG